jgi:hypothetical protein
MKQISVLLIWFCLCCPAVLAQKKVPVQYRKQFEQALAFWQSTFSAFSLDDFVASGQQQPFSGKVLRDFKSVAAMDSFYQLYQPMLAFARDSNRFLDLYSQDLELERQGDSVIAYANPGGGLLLCDRTKYACISIIRYGHSSWIDDAFWLDNTHFMLAGIVFTDFGLTGSPILYIGNTVTRMLQLYTNKNPQCLQQVTGYSGLRYKDLHIDGL